MNSDKKELERIRGLEFQDITVFDIYLYELLTKEQKRKHEKKQKKSNLSNVKSYV